MIECVYQNYIYLYLIQGMLWSWSYGSWIYNYLCHAISAITTNIV